jgi:hypothetical protein
VFASKKEGFSLEDKALEFANSEKMKLLNSSFSTFKYYPADNLTHLEEKLLHRLDLELSHRNPNIVMEVNADRDGKYKMDFSNGEYSIQKQCIGKEKCFDKLRDFMRSLNELPIARH